MSSETIESFWKKCSVCKTNINFGSSYYVCSVSTCNGQRTGLAFCRMQCFESHLPGARHRDAGAIEMKAPSSAPAAPNRILVRPAASDTGTGDGTRAIGAATTGAFGSSKKLPIETLVIASRLKDYVTARSDMNTAASVMDALSDHLRVVCDRAIENAQADGRKTIMDRDFQFLKTLK